MLQVRSRYFKFMVILGIIFLTSFVTSAEEVPYLRIPQTQKAPIINGKIDVKEWENAAMLSNFSTLSSRNYRTRPCEETRVWITYDKKRLYFAFRSTDMALNPLNHKMHEFKEIHNGDLHPYRDDSINVRLVPPKLKNLKQIPYYIAINSKGLVLGLGGMYIGAVLEDVKSWRFGGNGWGMSWEDARVNRQAKKYNGYWDLEFSVPFSAFGAVAKTDDVWRINIVRNYRSQIQKFSWLPLTEELAKYVNSPINLKIRELGKMVLGGQCPAVKVEPFSPNDLIKHKLPFAIWSSKPQDYTWSSSASDRGGKKKSANGKVKPFSGRKEFDISIPAGKDGHELSYSVRDANKKLLYHSPSYPLVAVDNFLSIKARADNLFDFFLNGKLLSSNKREMDLIKTQLRPGINIIAVRIPDGKDFAAVLKRNKKIFTTDKTWRFSTSACKDWEKPSFDDSSWKPVNVNEPKEQFFKEARSISGIKGKTLFLRKAILYKATQLFPLSFSPEQYLTKNGTYLFTWDGSGAIGWNSERKLHDLNLVVDVPEGLEFIGVGHTLSATSQTCSWRMTGKKKIGGQTFLRYEIRPKNGRKLKEKLSSYIAASRSGYTFALKAVGNVGQTLPVYYHISAFGGNYEEVPNQLSIKILPELNGCQPKVLTLLISDFNMFRFNNKQILREHLNTLKAAGINVVFAVIQNDIPKQLGIGVSWFFNFWCRRNGGAHGMAAVNLEKLIKRFPEAQGISFSGKKTLTPCLVYLAHHPEAWSFIDKEIENVKLRNPSQTELFWDYEFPIFQGRGTYHAFSPFGIKTFAAENNIKGTLTPLDIKKKYRTKWMHFTGRNMAVVMKKLRAICHKYGLRLTVWSGYEEFNKDGFSSGMRWEYVGPNVDMGYMGYGRPLKRLVATRHSLKGTSFNAGIEGNLKKLEHSVTSAVLLRRIVQTSKGGLHLWLEAGYDGRLLSNIAKISRIISQYEPFFLKDSRCEQKVVKLPKSLQDNVIVYSLADRVLMLFINESEKNIKIPVKLKKTFTELRDVQTNKNIKNTSLIVITVPKGEIRVLEGIIKK